MFISYILLIRRLTLIAKCIATVPVNNVDEIEYYLCSHAMGDSDLAGALRYLALFLLSSTSVIVSISMIAPTIGTVICIT